MLAWVVAKVIELVDYVCDLVKIDGDFGYLVDQDDEEKQ